MSNLNKWGAFTIEKGDNSFLIKIRSYLNQIYHLPRGKYLLDGILNLARPRGCENIFWTPCVIHYKPKVGAADTYGFPKTGTRIRIDPDYLRSKKKEDEFEPTKWQVVDADKEYIYLAHECIHVFHILNGTVKGKLGLLEDEINTTGLYEYENEILTENAFRYDLKLPRRPVYAWVPGQSLYYEEAEKRKRLELPPQPEYIRGKEDQFTSEPLPPPRPQKISKMVTPRIPIQDYRDRLADSRATSRDFLLDSRLTDRTI